MAAYYNEIDPYAAQWLRNLISAGHIAPGVVDERSILDVRPDDLRGFTQCHFFAGIGVWSYALRRAGWPDDRPVWTGSCPCQPFSVAGMGGGFNDERHLWPFLHHLISQCHPAVVFGEQVASADGLTWLDLVLADLEATGYAATAVDLCAAGVGAPHIRQRLYWVGDANHPGLEGHGRGYQAEGGRVGAVRPVAATGESVRVADTLQSGRAEGWAGAGGGQTAGGGSAGRMADDQRVGRKWWAQAGEPDGQGAAQRFQGSHNAQRSSVYGGPAGPTNGHWRAADWLLCRDDKWRAVESGTFPLAHGAAARVGRLRAYGNAIVAQVAEEFIKAYMEATEQ